MVVVVVVGVIVVGVVVVGVEVGMASKRERSKGILTTMESHNNRTYRVCHDNVHLALCSWWEGGGGGTTMRFRTDGPRAGAH